MASQRLKLNDIMPEFNLKGVDGKVYSPESFKQYKALIIIFSCNHCPYVQAYEDRIIAIQNDYAERGVAVAAINPNDDLQYPEDSFDEMKNRAANRGYNFTYLRDEDQLTAKAFGATHTPEIFLFNEERKLVYEGKIDDNWNEPDKVKSRYLREAIEELLNGEDISVPETWSIGCTIKWNV
jgi:peroxiredoxin